MIFDEVESLEQRGVVGTTSLIDIWYIIEVESLEQRGVIGTTS